MVDLSIAVSIIILSIYIKRRKLEPTKGHYIGDESGLVKRARDVVYYNTLNNITALIFPLIIALNSFTGFIDDFLNIIDNSLLRLFTLILIINMTALFLTSLITKIVVKRAIGKGELKKYIGGMWYKVISVVGEKD